MSKIQPATLHEIAIRMGVSRGTVSRVLRGMNKENRPAIAKRSEQIRQVAVELGYRPNVAARSIYNGKFDAVAFVTCGDLGQDWYPLSGLHGIHAKLQSLGWRMMFTELPADKIMNPELVPQLFREASVDGLIVNLIPLFSEEIVDYFEAQPLPCVWMNRKRPMRSVYPDEIAGARFAVKWLVDRGHRKIGFFSRRFDAPTHYSVLDRFNGFLAAMKESRLPAHRYLDPISDDEPDNSGLLDRGARFLNRFPDLDAVVCYEVEDATCLFTVARQIRGVSSQQIEIIGYGEREIRAVTGLPVPTLIVPFKEVGRKAVKMLSTMLEKHEREIASVSVPFASIEF